MAAETGCDLIVMGTHGRSGVHRLLTGSVAEKVLRHSSVPVALVRGSRCAPPPESMSTERQVGGEKGSA